MIHSTSCCRSDDAQSVDEIRDDVACKDCAFNDAGKMSFDGGCRQFETCISMSSEGTL